MKKILLIKLSIVALIFGLIGFILITIIAIVGYSTGSEYQKQLLSEMRENSTVINNQIYADRYRTLLNNHLKKDGYVTLERIVYYLQRTNNILDTSKLSYEKWEKAYLKNVDSEKKQMIPIKTICKDLKKVSNFFVSKLCKLYFNSISFWIIFNLFLSTLPLFSLVKI